MSRLKTLEAADLVRVVESEGGPERLYELDKDRLVGVAGGWIERFRSSADLPEAGRK